MSSLSSTPPSSVYGHPEIILRDLIRFDTTNPPGNEADCIGYIHRTLSDAGLETTLPARDVRRPNLVARWRGEGFAPPLLLYGHVDVVTTKGQHWVHPPFEGRLADGCIWGRGALDMKGGLAMMISALLRSRAEGLRPAGDLIFTALSDEETGSDFGAKYLVENHGALFEGARYAIGEMGGHTLYLGEKKFYPIQVAEKQVCWMKARLDGPGGHGSLPCRGGAMGKLGELLVRLDKRRLPVHITPVPREMIETMISELPPSTGTLLGQLLDPRTTHQALGQLGKEGQFFEAVLHNTVNATVVRGGDKINVVPSEIDLELDGRLLPGYGPDDMARELRKGIDEALEVEVIRYDAGSDKTDMGLFNTLSHILGRGDPDGIPLPLLTPAFTDARLFARLGIQTYGFTPMNLPRDFNFSQLIHGANERIPVDALTFGSNAIHELLGRYAR
jgi:acetylornithine deacetylase/succinyl-diaminopimelate desuccinylase-like protein